MDNTVYICKRCPEIVAVIIPYSCRIPAGVVKGTRCTLSPLKPRGAKKNISHCGVYGFTIHHTCDILQLPTVECSYGLLRSWLSTTISQGLWHGCGQPRCPIWVSLGQIWSLMWVRFATPTWKSWIPENHDVEDHPPKTLSSIYISGILPIISFFGTKCWV